MDSLCYSGASDSKNKKQNKTKTYQAISPQEKGLEIESDHQWLMI